MESGQAVSQNVVLQKVERCRNPFFINWIGSILQRIGHQNSGVPIFFWRAFLSLHAHSCWLCHHKIKFCVEHINTLGKKHKFLKLKQETCLSARKTRTLVASHQNSGAPPICLQGFLPSALIYAGNIQERPDSGFSTKINLANKRNSYF